MSRLRNKCELCWPVFEATWLKIRQLHRDIERLGLSGNETSNLTHTQQKLAMFIEDAADDHHHKLLHKYEGKP